MSESSAVEQPEILASEEPSMSVDIEPATEEQESDQDKLRRLEEDLQVRTEERENFKNKLQAAEKEIADLKNALELQAADIGDSEDAGTLDQLQENNNSLREALNKAAEIIKDKTSLCTSQERQILALTNQNASLKEVIKITKDLLNIRNMEVHHLQSDVDSMEGKIKMERERQSAMIAKMDEAVKLNAELKSEYVNQLKIFQDLKARYEEKVQLLEKENKAQKEIISKTALTNGEVEVEEPSEGKPGIELDESAATPRDIGRKGITRVDSTASDLDEFLDAHEEIASI